jgi:hypothetical protein
MFKRIRKSLTSRRPQRVPVERDGQVERFALSAEVPIGAAGAPLWRVDVQVLSEPHADGEKLRVRAHLQTNLGSALRPALEQRDHARTADDRRLGDGERRALTLAQRAGNLMQRGAARALRVPLINALAQPLLQLDFNTWIEIDASTASLDSGSRDLLPQADRLARLGIHPRTAGDQPVAESWAHEAANGFAQVSVVQMDKKHLPQRLAAMLGETPFHLAAAIVNTVEEKK